MLPVGTGRAVAHLLPCAVQDFNRLVVPDRLVTWGPYGAVQHPLYTSYMLLFAGHCLR